MIGEPVFCEKRKILWVANAECWNCEHNIINGGVCYPWPRGGVRTFTSV